MTKRSAFDLYEQHVDDVIQHAMCNTIDRQKRYIERLENEISALKSALRRTTRLNLSLTNRLTSIHGYHSQ